MPRPCQKECCTIQKNLYKRIPSVECPKAGCDERFVRKDLYYRHIREHEQAEEAKKRLTFSKTPKLQLLDIFDQRNFTLSENETFSCPVCPMKMPALRMKSHFIIKHFEMKDFIRPSIQCIRCERKFTIGEFPTHKHICESEALMDQMSQAIGSKRRRSEPVARSTRLKLDKKTEKTFALPPPKRMTTEDEVFALESCPSNCNSPKLKSKRLSVDQTEILMETFEISKWPEPKMVANLAECLAISQGRVRKWFVSKRHKTRTKQNTNGRQSLQQNSLVLVTESESE